MGTRGPPQAPPRRLTALRRRDAVGIGAISADMVTLEWDSDARPTAHNWIICRSDPQLARGLLLESLSAQFRPRAHLG
jgi:hypothetical protein